MEYIYASLALHAAGKEINEENLKKMLEAVGIQVDEVRIKAVVAALNEINIDEVVKAATAMPAAPVAAAPVEAEEKKEEKKKEEEEEEEKKEEAVSDEQIAAGLGGLFGF